MKLLIQNARIAGTATYDYTGPDAFIDAPVDFDISRMGEYVIEGGVASIPPAGVPQSVTMRQARLALLAAGLLAAVETAITAAGPAAKIEWDYATEVQRSAGLVPAMATALGMTDLQIDALFVTASTL